MTKLLLNCLTLSFAVSAAAPTSPTPHPHSQLLSMVNSSVFNTAPVLVSLAAFGTYAGLGHPLTAAVAFPSLALFNLLRFPIVMIPQQIFNLIAARVVSWVCVWAAGAQQHVDREHAQRLRVHASYHKHVAHKYQWLCQSLMVPAHFFCCAVLLLHTAPAAATAAAHHRVLLLLLLSGHHPHPRLPGCT